MKKFLVIALALALAGCSAVAPFVQANPTAGPTSRPQVIYQTVVVTVLVTAPATETPIPTATWTPIPTFTPQPATATLETGTPLGTGTAGSVQYTATPGSVLYTATPGTPFVSGSPSATLPANAGGTLFSNLTRSNDQLFYSCSPSDITFGLTATSSTVYEVDFFYRLEYKNSSLTTNWVDVGKMLSDGNGNFTFDFKASMIPSDLRTRSAWVDYQFVGLNRSLQVIGRSSMILQQLSFSPTCP